MDINDLEPKGGANDFWPVSQDDFDRAESLIGWPIDNDLKAILSTHGGGSPIVQMSIPKTEHHHGIRFAFFYKGNQLGSVEQTEEFGPVTPFAKADVGRYFINQAGVVCYSGVDSEYEYWHISDSFNEFMEKVTVYEDEPEDVTPIPEPQVARPNVSEDLVFEAVANYRRRSDTPLVDPESGHPLVVVDRPETGELSVLVAGQRVFRAWRTPGTQLAPLDDNE